MKAWRRFGDSSPHGPHRIFVYAAEWVSGTWIWYTGCNGCDWEPWTTYTWPDGTRRWGRPHWDLALALGIAHLREECKHV